MEREEEKEVKYVYYKKNVNYTIGVRYFIGDNQGKSLTESDPFVAVRENKDRDFKRANQRHFKDGLLISTTEPSYDVDTVNDIDDEKAHAVVKNVMILKKTLKEIDSPSIISKLLQIAKDDNRSHKTIEMIEARLEEFDVESPLLMRGLEEN